MKKYLIDDSSKNTFRENIASTPKLIFTTIGWHWQSWALVQHNIGSPNREHEKCPRCHRCSLHLVLLFPLFVFGVLFAHSLSCVYWLPNLQPQHQWVGDDDPFWILGYNKVPLSTQKHIFRKFNQLLNHILVGNLSVSEFQMSLGREAHKQQSFQLCW